MKIEFHKGYVLVVAPMLVYLAALPTGAAKTAKAMAFFPFIVVRDMSVVEPWLINHERIHFRQEVELLIVGFWILYLAEYFYDRVILRLSSFETYLRMPGEQEAYLNQHNLNYLNERKPFAQFKYFFRKTKFTIDNKGGVFITK